MGDVGQYHIVCNRRAYLKYTPGLPDVYLGLVMCVLRHSLLATPRQPVNSSRGRGIRMVVKPNELRRDTKDLLVQV